MSARALLALVLVLGVGLAAFAFPATAAAACDPANIKGGTHYVDSKGGSVKHHVVSQ